MLCPPAAEAAQAAETQQDNRRRLRYGHQVVLGAAVREGPQVGLRAGTVRLWSQRLAVAASTFKARKPSVPAVLSTVTSHLDPALGTFS